jgi:hypothetical protein
MQFALNSLRFLRHGGKVSVLARIVGHVASALILLLVWLGADPEAHEHFHHDADQGEHHCVITEYAAGEGFYVVPQVSIPPVEAVFGFAHFSAEEPLRESVDYVLLPTCGPPSGGLEA